MSLIPSVPSVRSVANGLHTFENQYNLFVPLSLYASLLILH
jgi:hypothetical protein